MISEPHRWLGETGGFWIQTAILAISAAAGLLIITTSRKQEERRATVDLIIDQKRDQELTEARRVIKEMHERLDMNLSRYLQDTNSAEYKAILLALNTYEFVAAGVRTKAFDEVVYKRLRCSTVLRDWEAFRGFIIEFRNMHANKQTLFQDFEWLAKRWKAAPLEPNE